MRAREINVITCQPYPGSGNLRAFRAIRHLASQKDKILTKNPEMSLKEQVVKEYPVGDETKLAGLSYNMRRNSQLQSVSDRRFHL